MDLHYDCAESPAAEQPSGKINKTAFKLFGKRRSGSAMPAIFGVKNKGEGKSTGKMGMVRSKTLDGLADVVLESNKKEEQWVETGAGGDLNPEISPKEVTINAADVSSVAKSHSFFSLLKRSSRTETVKGENAEQRPGSRQKKGLKGIFNSMRWSKKDKSYKDAKEGSSDTPSGLILPVSLTASLECIKEEIQKPLCEKEKSSEDIPTNLPREEIKPSVEEIPQKESEESPCSVHISKEPQQEDDLVCQHVEDLCQLPEPKVETPQEKDEDLTGCGDIIADHDEEGGNVGVPKVIPGYGKKVTTKTSTNVVAYQGGGEEMASPEQVDDNYIEECLSIIPQPEGLSEDTEVVGGITQASGEVKNSEIPCNKIAVKPTKLKPVSIIRKERDNQNSKGNEKRQGVRNSDEGYWDSTTPGHEEEPRIVGKQAIARDSCSGDALYDLYSNPDENFSKGHAEEGLESLPQSKPISPVTAMCPVKTASFNKDSKIPISKKHFPVHPPSQGADASSSSSAVPHPVKSELPRTKIPVSKVLVRRVSNKVITEAQTGKRALRDPVRK
ncbi:hypothetical protein GDO86_004616 [Hymenochirus boettgeri]|uniref:APC membrane recruitment protein 2 n=1 Tax=Hymenochirus boettgeri TaxID=247094 RepID=A0A8T2K5V0_9PIPI|nr:hypothetical protein GDO86_004616 [Hymenochirus boettgeri]